MRKAAILAADLSWVALSAFLAVVIRDNFIVDWDKLIAVAPYAAIAVCLSALVFLSAGITKTLWRFTSLSDVLRVIAAVTVALLLALFVSFVLNRMEGVARSVPLIQWLLLVAGLIGSRTVFRVLHDQTDRRDWHGGRATEQYALIIGVNHLTELYLEAAADYASEALEIVGLLTDRQELHGRLLRRQKILGMPEDLPRVMQQLEVHGINLNRILVVEPYEKLSPPVRAALSTVERAGSVRVDWLVERLGLDNVQDRRVEDAPQRTPHGVNSDIPKEELPPWLGTYQPAKRLFDVSITLLLAPVLIPLGALVAFVVALDVGGPLVFWQLRPGRDGRPFKLFKFRTMRAAHDKLGNRRLDEHRSSTAGRLLRRTKLDELPQLYNVLVGEMSLVGPRPLLPQDQPGSFYTRLMARPGLTGFAQVNGGRDISAEDKNVLDLWYVKNASVWLDIKLLLRTFTVIFVGERANLDAVRAARTGLGHMKHADASPPNADKLRLATTADPVR